MKRRIEQLLNGIYEYEAPEMLLPKEKIELVLKKGESFRGSFMLSNAAEKKMKGFIYSTSARMAYEPTDFFGVETKIIYEADTKGMQEGDVLEGEFTICSNLGEYKIPYRIEIERAVIKTSTSEIHDMEEFTQLAMQDFQKAYVLFLSPEFSKMIKRCAPEHLALYEGIRNQAVSYSCMEEFLIGCGRKNPIHLSLEKRTAVFDAVTANTQEKVQITKDGWGFLRIDITSDAEFLTIEHPVVTTDEFLGSSYDISYIIDESRLHGGKNFARVRIETCYETLEFVVTASRSRQARDKSVWKQHKAQAAMMRSYIDFRMRKMDINAWIENTQDAVMAYQRAGGDNTMITLLHVQMLFAEDKSEEACIILDRLDDHKEKLNTPEILGYYLYLTTFYNKDLKYVDYIEEQVESLFLQNRESWVLQWILFYLQERYLNHPSDKLGAICQQFIYGCRSPIMYIEAYQLLLKEPMLMKRLDDFYIQLLKFICREGAMTKTIAMQVTDVSMRYKVFSEDLYGILEKCYELYPSRELVSAVCSLLIKGHRTGNEYFKWYEKGVEKDIRLTGLYEYYIESMGSFVTKQLPQIIRMYFSYNNTLGYRKKAFVYANVIRNREFDSQTYQSYRPAMEKFMIDQLAAGRVNADLALIYRTFLTKQLLNKKLADGLAKTMFTYELTCEVPGIRKAVVIHSQLNQEQIVPVVNGKAYVQIYADDYVLFLADEAGARYASSVPYRLTRLMDEEAFLGYCEELVPDNPGLVLYKCSCAEKRGQIQVQDTEEFRRLLEFSEVREDYKKQLRQEILNFYYENRHEESLYEYLHRIDFEDFVRVDKKKLIELLADEGMCAEAFELVSVYGPEHIDLAAMVKICSRMILQLEYERDAMLENLCFYCFSSGKYDETILDYLINYYDGPVDSMKWVWRAARRFEMDAFTLEEKILVFMLFMRTGGKGTEEVFESYRRKLGKKAICRAYAIFQSYQYFVRGIPVRYQVFQYVQRGFEKGKETPEVCKLALLKYYSQQRALLTSQRENVKKLLEEFATRQIRFAFYQKFDPALLRAYQLSDKTFIEYHTNPEAHVVLHYRVEGGREPAREQAVAMRNLFEGIFSEEFTLFYGEKLVYYFTVDLNGKEKITEEQEIVCSNKAAKTGSSRYELINQMSRFVEEGNEEAARDRLFQYLKQEALAEELFPPM